MFLKQEKPEMDASASAKNAIFFTCKDKTNMYTQNSCCTISIDNRYILCYYTIFIGDI